MTKRRAIGIITFFHENNHYKKEYFTHKERFSLILDARKTETLLYYEIRPFNLWRIKTIKRHTTNIIPKN